MPPLARANAVKMGQPKYRPHRNKARRTPMGRTAYFELFVVVYAVVWEYVCVGAGDESVVSTVSPLFELMGKNIKHMGPAGSGQHTKMVNQILIASTMIGVVEGMLYAKKYVPTLAIARLYIGTVARSRHTHVSVPFALLHSAYTTHERYHPSLP